MHAKLQGDIVRQFVKWIWKCLLKMILLKTTPEMYQRQYNSKIVQSACIHYDDAC